MLNIVKNTTLPGLLDLLAPHSCRGCGHLGEPLCDCCKNYIIKQHQDICPNCKQKLLHGRCPNCKDLLPIYVVGNRSNLLDTIIHEYKYSSVRALAPALASLLDSVLPKDTKNATIIPLPTSTKHIRERALDHTLLIAKYLARLRHFKIEKALIRARNTVQVGADRTTRKSQASSAYTLSSAFRPQKGTTYILLDDVWTTGASMKAAIKKLRDAGAQNLIVLLLAYSEFKD